MVDPAPISLDREVSQKPPIGLVPTVRHILVCLDRSPQAEAGLPPINNPVLDTIFLSYALHRGIEGHSLEAIAERMGITIEGRHSSLGDARAAAQIFLGLLTLLPGRGVRTLAEAKAFCDQHLLLRWQTSRF